jgi:hypothetical protein
MHTHIAYAPNGIPVRFNNKSEPLFSGLRKTLGLKTEKRDEKPTAEKTTITLRRPYQNTTVTKGAVPIHPSTYEYCEGETLEEEDVMPSVRSDELLVLNGSAERGKMAATKDQRDDRTLRNRHKKVVRVGKRKPVKVKWLWRPYPHEPLYDITLMRCHESSALDFYHDSHGKHGRKPRYKDFWSAHARI